jgi:hypothetical protein
MMAYLLATTESHVLSSHQIKFLEDHRDCASVVLVQFEGGEAVSKRELTIDELRAEFNFNPIKYKLGPSIERVI